MAQNNHIIRVVELFAGVGGFRIGLEGASDAYETIWNNQWEPSTKHQDASLVYQARFGKKGHSNQDINLVKQLKFQTMTCWSVDFLVKTTLWPLHSAAREVLKVKRECYGGKSTASCKKRAMQNPIIYFLRTLTAY